MSPSIRACRPAMPELTAFLRRARQHRSFAAGGLLTALVLGMALLSLIWTPYAATQPDVRQRLAAPSAAHWLGTDALGREIVSQLLAGAQNSLLVAVLAVGIGLALGGLLGFLAAARPGRTEELVMRCADFTFAFPAVLSAIMQIGRAHV